MSDTCVFCHLIETDQVEQSSVNPVTPGHLLFVPKRHSSNAAENPTEAASAVLAAAQHLARIGGQANIITSIGPAATQSVWHTHVHLVPRLRDDGLALPWTGQVPS